VWTLQSATVALSYTSIVYNRRTDDVEQNFHAMVWNNGEMTLFASEYWKGEGVEYVLANEPRAYINSDAEITEMFYKTCFAGKVA
jgi:hypothetical protein